MSGNYCVSCGNPVGDTDEFCNKCGAHIESKKQLEEQQPRTETTSEPRVVEYEFKQLPYEKIGFFKVYTFSNTYLNLLYLMLLLPIGIALFTVSVTLFSTFAGLIAIFIGIILLYFFFISLPYIMRAFGWFGKQLVGVELPPKQKNQKRINEIANEESIWKRSIMRLADKKIWISLFYFLVLVMPIGIFTFTLVVAVLSTALGLTFSWVALIVEYAIYGDLFNNGWVPYTVLPPAFWICVYIITPIIGFFMLTASLHLFNKTAIIHARMIAKLATL